MSKQKFKNAMERTFLKKKFTLKKMSLVRNRGVYRLWQYQRRLNNHQNSPSNHSTSSRRKNEWHTWLFTVNPCVYAEIEEKPACIRDCELKTRVQEKRCIKSRQTDKARQTSHRLDTTMHTCPHTRHKNKRERAIQIHWMPIKQPPKDKY